MLESVRGPRSEEHIQQIVNFFREFDLAIRAVILPLRVGNVLHADLALAILVVDPFLQRAPEFVPRQLPGH